MTLARREFDVAAGKDLATPYEIAFSYLDPSINFRSTTARHRSSFASSSLALAPVAMTRFSASASCSQSGVYAITTGGRLGQDRVRPWLSPMPGTTRLNFEGFQPFPTVGMLSISKVQSSGT
jgi:hypothetical protein